MSIEIIGRRQKKLFRLFCKVAYRLIFELYAGDVKKLNTPVTTLTTIGLNLANFVSFIANAKMIP